MRAAVLALVLVAQPARSAPLPFIHDDWPRALAAAKQRDLPLFVEAWAPW